MATAAVAFAFLLRFIAPHDLFSALAGVPMVPAVTALMILAIGYGLLRKRIDLGLPPQLLAQWALFLWAGISLAINEGSGSLRLLVSDFIKDLVFISAVAVAVDRVSRLKVLLAAILASFLFIGSFGLPQLWGPRQCGEWAGNDMINLVFDGRPCKVSTDCDRNQPKKRLVPGIGPRSYRCEHRGPFAVAAYVGRLRWVGNFQDVNNLGSMVALAVPIVILWASSLPRRRWLSRYLVLPGLAALFAVMVVATGSRGSQLGLLVGTAIAMARVFGKKAVLVGVLGLALISAVVLSTGKLTIRDERSFEASTKVSDRYRTDAMHTGFRLWREFPVFGVGYQNFEDFHLIDPHNAFLAALGELGTLGMLIFAFAMWLNFKGAWLARQRAKREGRLELEKLYTGILAGLVGGTLSLTLFLSTYCVLNWMVLLLVGGAMLRSARREFPDLELRVSRWDLLGSSLGALLLTGATYLGLAVYYTIV